MEQKTSDFSLTTVKLRKANGDNDHRLSNLFEDDVICNLILHID